MDEEKLVTTEGEAKEDFSYMAKLARAYAEAQKERRKNRMSEEKRDYLIQMQLHLRAIAKALISYFEREEKKELAAMVYKNAGDSLLDLQSESQDIPLRTEPAVSLLTTAVLLSNRSLNLLDGSYGTGDLLRYVLSEISALYALAAID